MTATSVPAPSTRRGRALRRVAVAVVATATSAAVAACGVLPAFGDPPDSPQPRPKVAVVVADHANSAPLAPRDPVLVDLVGTLVQQRALVVVIGVDGAPRVIGQIDLADRTDNEVQRRNQDDRYTASLLTAFTGARATVGEADYPTALDLGCRSVAGGAPGSSVQIVGSGLSTVGLRIQDGLLAPGVSAGWAVDQLERSGAVPDLRACPDIHWRGLGATAAPQPAPTIAGQRRLEDLVSTFVARGGGHLTIEQAPLQPGPVPEGLPPVTVVGMDEQPPVLPPVFTEAQLGFLPGSASLRDPAAAREALADAAAAILDRRIPDVWVVGTAAADGADNVALSRRRADAVCDLLVEGYGVPSSVLHPVGVGTAFPGFVADRNPDGSLDETQARKNRLVLLRTEPLTP